MIRLGSLAGYPFEGPRLLGGWTPPAVAAVYAIAYKPDERHPDRYAVIYVDQSGDLTAERFPFKHPRSPCWVQRAGSRWKLHVCWYEVPGGGQSHREQITSELIAIYRPGCNESQYENVWQDTWIAPPNRENDPFSRLQPCRWAILAAGLWVGFRCGG